jgi:hypothetical protein
MTANLIGVGLVIGFCLYSISRLRQNGEADTQTKRKAIAFYLFIMAAAITYLIISYLFLVITGVEVN